MSVWNLFTEVIIPITDQNHIFEIPDYSLLFDKTFLHLQLKYTNADSPSAIKNFAAKSALGKYLFFIESSSFLFTKPSEISNKIPEILQYMEENSDQVGILGSTILFTNDTNVYYLVTYNLKIVTRKVP